MARKSIADLFDIHSNVARHHLDRLVSDGYLQVTRKRPEGRTGPGAGRPAKHYEPTRKDVSVQFPARRYDLLTELLLRVIERVAPDNAAYCNVLAGIYRSVGTAEFDQITLIPLPQPTE